MKKFSADINLDDKSEANDFLAKYGNLSGRAIANRLGFRGTGAAAAANALRNYASNKVTAINCRKDGRIGTAEMYEIICDKIYTRNIQPNIECW